MIRAEAGTCIAVEIFIEENVVAELGIGLKQRIAVIDGPLAFVIFQEKRREALREALGCLRKTHPFPRTAWQFDTKTLPQVEVEPLQSFNEKKVHGEPH